MMKKWHDYFLPICVPMTVKGLINNLEKEKKIINYIHLDIFSRKALLLFQSFKSFALE